MSINLPTTRAPKRAMQRRFSLIRLIALVSSAINNTVHTVAERKTLTRTRITGIVLYTGTANDITMTFALSIWRNGKQVIDTITATETLDNAEPLELIVREVYGGDDKDVSGVAIPIKVEIDTKAQRKLFPGD